MKDCTKFLQHMPLLQKKALNTNIISDQELFFTQLLRQQSNNEKGTLFQLKKDFYLSGRTNKSVCFLEKFE